MLPKTALLALLVLVLGSAGGAAADTGFSGISSQYEAIGNPCAPSMVRCGEIVQR